MARHIEKFRRLKERNKPVVLSDFEPGSTPTGERKDKKKIISSMSLSWIL